MTSAIRTIAVALLVGLAGPEFGGPAIPGGQPRAVTYNIIDLGTLGGVSSVALGVNDKAQVVGSADTPQGLRHAYLWENGVMIDLGTLGLPAGQSEAWDINNHGVVVGPVGGGDPNKSFIWENGVQTEIGPPQVLKSAYGINDAKQVVGIYVVAPSGDRHAFLWQNGVLTDLGTLGGTYSIAWDINQSGQVVGKAFTMSAERAFLWQNAVMTDLGTLGGENSAAYGINDIGQVVGSAASAAGSLSAFLWQDGVMTDLGALGGFDSSRAEAINNYGVVVGRGGTGQQAHAFVYDPQLGMRYLEDTIPPGSGWSDLSPRNINNAGWIVGSGTSPAGRHAFLMTPTLVIPTLSGYGGEVMTFLILTCGMVVILRARGRRDEAAP